MARVATETIIFDITCWLVPGTAFLGIARQHGDLLLYIVGGVFFAIYLVLQYFRLKKQG